MDVPERRLALVVANAHYDDAALEQLASPAQDADALGRVLGDPGRCGFDVTPVLDGESGAVVDHIMLARTELAPASAAAPAPRVAAPSPVRARRTPVVWWWASALGVVAACIAATWATEAWLMPFSDNWLAGDEFPSNYSLPVILGLAGVWGAAYAFVAFLGGRTSDWRDPWRPLAAEHRGLGTPRRLSAFASGLVTAVPVNIVLVVAAALFAAWLGYTWAGGSTARDDYYQFTFAALALAGIVRYLTWGTARARRTDLQTSSAISAAARAAPSDSTGR